ncbi:serine acetyltransferase [Klebsiella quasipneumoniae subsp. quasipneumoniae]|nr:serine acetyltransferase [Klebsiella quasipneumoniae subsp. quasipneumoniae]
MVGITVATVRSIYLMVKMENNMLDFSKRIVDKKTLRYFLECDRLALKKSYNKPKLFRDSIWRFQILLRKTEYWSNKHFFLARLIYLAHLFLYKRQCVRYSVEIPLNCIGEGLVIWHLNGIIINPECKIGSNCSISAGVVIGHAKGKVPYIGNNVHIMLGTKILGANVCNNVTIGAASLVIKDITEPYTV